MSLIGSDRSLRVCDLCGGVDDHPRHSFAGTVPGEAVTQAPTQEVVDKVLDAAPADQRSALLATLYDVTTTDRHRDCCAAAGCPAAGDPKDGCNVLVAGAKGTGKAMLQNIVAKREKAAKTQDEER